MASIQIHKIHFHRQSYEQLRGLMDLLSFIPKDSILVELGSYSGSSAEIFANKCKRVYCIDHYDWTPEFHNVSPDIIKGYFKKNILERFDNVELIIKKTNEAHTLFDDNSIDVLYIDAFHGYESVKEDSQNWMPKVKKGGIMAGHDYNNPNTPGVKKAIDEVLGLPVYLFCDWSFLIYK